MAPQYRWDLERKILLDVKRLKDHPALLCWTLGNEVFSYTQGREELYRLGRFYKSLVGRIHREDPNHPIVYAVADKKDLDYLKAFVPDMDIVGVNTFGDFNKTVSWLSAND